MPSEEHRVVEDLEKVLPAWRRKTEGERPFAYVLAIVGVGVLQAVLPVERNYVPWWVFALVEGVLLGVLVAGNPKGERMDKHSQRLRVVAMALIAVVSAGTAFALILLIRDIVSGVDTGGAGRLLATGADVYVINILTFAVWYWELDRGGAVERAIGTKQFPDFLFPQMTAPGMASKEWEPEFADYFYLAFTNSTAFSPTDVLPFSRWAKMLMLGQSAVALVTAALVVAKAVNALG